MIYLTESFKYVTGDLFFLPSMAVVVIMSLFVGATVFNGDVKLLSKYIFTFFTYSLLLTFVNLTRIVPDIFNSPIVYIGKPLAGTLTNLFVTVAYLLGIYLGVLITKKAHKGGEK